MVTIRTNATVTTEGMIVLPAPPGIPPGEHRVVLVIEEGMPINARRTRRSLKGLWADLKVGITEEDIAEARREMWGNFPRHDV